MEIALRDGKPDGVVNAWFPSGARKSRITFENGKQTGKEFWKDPAEAPGPLAAAAED